MFTSLGHLRSIAKQGHTQKYHRFCSSCLTFDSVKVTAIVNGASKQLQLIQQELSALSNPPKVLITSKAGEATSLTQQAMDDGAELIIAAGGDGTLNEVVNGMMSGSSSDCQLALLPRGSANDYVRVLGNRSLSEKLETAESGSVEAVDLVRIHSEHFSKYLANISACGIGAEIAHTVNKRRHRMLPAINYYSAIIHWLLRYKAPLIRITTDEETIEKRCFLAAVGKGKYAGNGLGLLPQSDLGDEKLGLTIIELVTVFDFLRYQNTLKRGERVQDKRVHYLSSARVELEVLDGRLAIDTDGEFLTHLEKGQKVTLEVLPSALKLV